MILLLGNYDKNLIDSLPEKYAIRSKSINMLENIVAITEKIKVIVFRSPFVIDESILRVLPNLKAIIRAGSGIDGIDKQYLEKNNIKLYATGTYSRSVSELALALFLSAERSIYKLALSIKTGKWEKGSNFGKIITGKRLFVIGLGAIGNDFLNLCQNFNFEILIYDRSPERKNEVLKKFGAKVVSLNYGFANADLILVSCSYNSETHHLVTAKELSNIGSKVTIVNISRGMVFNEKDLMSFLIKNKEIIYATDVLHNEPMINREFVALENVIPLPHVGAQTYEARKFIDNRVLTILESTCSKLL
ncbi:MAG: hypothetical protein IMY67_10095 [Bacteroidetes bacterium]|nr:hypothetical protein [Bacteroidota bacterium]